MAQHQVVARDVLEPRYSRRVQTFRDLFVPSFGALMQLL